MNDLELALHLLADDGSSGPTRSDLADRVLSRARQRSRRRGTLAAVSSAAVVALLAVAMTTVGTQPSRHRAAGGPATTSTTSSGFTKARMNVLLVGTDAVPGRAGVRPDTMILASVDTRTGATVLFGFPRNLQRVPFPAGTAQAAAFGHGFVCARGGCLLNGLWTWAEGAGAKYYPGDRHPGLTATKQAIEQISGLNVDDTAVVNLKGLVQLVDAVGGVDVNVRQRLPIGGNTENQQAPGGYIERGKQHLDGYRALWFARSRWAGDDYDRMRRQQCLLTALVSKPLDARTLITRYPQIARVLAGNLQTSISVDDLSRWAALVPLIRGTQIWRVGLVSDSTHPDFPDLRNQVARALRSPASSDPQGSSHPQGSSDPQGTAQAAGSTSAARYGGWMSRGTC